MSKSQKPDSVEANSTKRLASRFYQLNTGHTRTGQYLHWAKMRPTAQRWWCQYPSQTRDHLFKVCPEWKMQQKILWAEVQKETGRCGRSGIYTPIGDADRRCWTSSPQRMWEGWCRLWKRVTLEPGVRVGAPGTPGAGRGMGGGGAGCYRGIRVGEERPLFLPTPSFMASADEG